jgi:hypothetical protein
MTADQQKSSISSRSRRQFLRGAGASLALPLFPTLFTGSAATAAEKSGAPVRLGFLFFPNGVYEEGWKPKTAGSDYQLPFCLEPLSDLKREVTVITGLDKRNSHGGDGHYAKTANFLTGMPVAKTTGRDISSGGISVDQLAAEKLGKWTPLPSLELSTEPVVSGVDSNVGYTRLYGSHISWQTPTRPVARELSPKLVYERLFGKSVTTDKQKAQAYQNLLDYVLEDAHRVRGKLGRDDVGKMDEYLDAVRSVEKRIEFSVRNQSKEKSKSRDLGSDELAARFPGVPGDFRDHIDLMLDLMVLAFRSDSTRVASLMLANDVSGRNFSCIEGVRGGHHEMSHHEMNADKIDQYNRITRWYVEQYAKFLGKLSQIKEGNRTLLDNSVILLGSSIADGNGHVPDNLPIVIAGKGGGTLKTGQHLAAGEGDNTPLCNLYVTMLRAARIPAESFGDSSGPLMALHA